jgi:hypothetical protein
MPSLEAALILITDLVGATGLESRVGLIAIAAPRGRIES